MNKSKKQKTITDVICDYLRDKHSGATTKDIILYCDKILGDSLVWRFFSRESASFYIKRNVRSLLSNETRKLNGRWQRIGRGIYRAK